MLREHLISLEISRCDELVALLPRAQQRDTAFPSLLYIAIKECPKVKSLQVELSSTSEFLGISECERLFANRMDWDIQPLTSVRHSVIMDCENELEYFPPEMLLRMTLTTLEVSSLPNIKTLNGEGFQHLGSLQQLSISDCNELQRLPDLPSSLSYLCIEGRPLLNPRCQREEGEDSEYAS